jgi:acyl-CoA reductase-like NAD-dependent aldehyde dehydrogenase
MSIDTAKHDKLAADVLPTARLFVDGTWSDRATGGSLPHVNLSTARVQAEIPMAGEREIDYVLPEPYGVVGLIMTWNGRGQGCVLPARLLIHASIHDQVLERVLSVFSFQDDDEAVSPSPTPRTTAQGRTWTSGSPESEPSPIMI